MPPPTVFFLSDYGTQDEFVGVVHAVLGAGQPAVQVIDLTHQIPAFDVRAGAYALCRSAPYLPPGIVLAVVDPGVGTSRLGLCVRVESTVGPTLFVGPDNGLLIDAAELVGGGSIAQAFELHRDPDAERPGATFDGRDLFAPAVRQLCAGADPAELGQEVDPHGLVRLFPGVVERGRDAEGRPCLRCEVSWVDRFGNVQLAATSDDARAAGLPMHGAIDVGAPESADGASGLPDALIPKGCRVRWVETFADLGHGELGLLVDANGHLAVVAGQASAAHWLNVASGELLILSG